MSGCHVEILCTLIVLYVILVATVVIIIVLLLFLPLLLLIIIAISVLLCYVLLADQNYVSVPFVLCDEYNYDNERILLQNLGLCECFN